MPRLPAIAERQRLKQDREGRQRWKRWGPYLSERTWGTVREDYSADGSAWTFLTHDMARSTAYRWGEDGLGGICDDQQILCFALALWNGRDPILKERLFGLSGTEGNHGEDVKELYYYLDSTPTHSYMKFLYRYPQAAFPYDQLVAENAARTRADDEFELLDTGVLADCRYFDVVVEYAKASPEQIAIRITAINHGPDPATLHLIPQLWFRNTWSWTDPPEPEPSITPHGHSDGLTQLDCRHPILGDRHLYAAGMPEVLFTCNETNQQRLHGQPNRTPAVKDAFDQYLVQGRSDVLSPVQQGTKAGLHYHLDLPPGGSAQLQLLLTDCPSTRPFATFDQTFARRLAEADQFYDSIHSPALTPQERLVQRQAFAGLLWSKQFYCYDVDRWLHGDPGKPSVPQRLHGRNSRWSSLYAADILSMPDKWEYPWFAAWDMAFHAISLAMIDIDLAKQQLEHLVGEELMHPSGQIPAYEWEFSDVNPPVQAWAVWRVYNAEKHANGEHGDRVFLKRCYHKLLMNFTWWVNRKDVDGRNIFEGGFLGLDNISVFDRSQPLPGGPRLEQADATGWMALFCLNLMAIGLELAQEEPVYEHLGSKFFEHFLSISSAINDQMPGGGRMWDETDGWYYDVIRAGGAAGQTAHPLAVRSLVGLVPLFAAQVLEHRWFDKLPYFKQRYEWLLTNRLGLSGGMVCIWTPDGAKCLLSIVNYDRLKTILRRVLDETEFLSPHGLRSLSRYHLDHPFVLACGPEQWTVRYEPAESRTALFGGNSNWRGPVWLPTAFMLITALRVYDRFYGDGFQIECPTGSGNMMTLNQVALEIGRRLCSLFLPDASGRRPSCAADAVPGDPHWADLLLFHEYFDADTGRGLGASHQTGWTALVAKLLDQQAAARGKR